MRNIMRTPTLAGLLVLCAAVSASAAEPKPQTVEVEGQAAIVGNDKAAARDRAIEDGLRKAVEQAVGTWVTSASKTVDFQLVEDKILSESKGYVKKYDVLKQGIEDGVYVVQLKAVVNTGDLGKDLESIAMALERKDKPKLLVMVMEQNVGGQPNTWWASEGFSTNLDVVENTFVEEWRPQGFRFVDRQALKGSIQVTSAMQSSEITDAAAREFASKTDAQVVIVGKAVASNNGPVMNTSLNSVAANVSLRVINIGNGDIMATSTQSATFPHVNVIEGGTQALKKATKKACEDLSQKVLAVWAAESSGPQSFKVTVVVDKSKTLRQFKGAMKDYIRGLQAVRDRGFENGKGFLDIELKGRMEDLLADLEEKEWPGFDISVEGYDSASLTVKVSQHK